MTNNDMQKRAMIAALEKSLGIVTTACKTLNISRETHYRWLREDPEYKQAVEELQEVAIDFAESSLHKRINEGSDACIIFFLKTKGKKRGYVQEQSQDNNLNINIVNRDE
jgi:hypothetical protein